jgi:uroporphyrinogen-III synthase
MPLRPLICLVRSKALDADAAELFALANTDVMQISMIDQVIQDAASIDAALTAASNAQWLIFVSPFAVHAAQQLLPNLFERTQVQSRLQSRPEPRQWAAVGQSTARALHGALGDLPIDQVWQPSADQEGSAALLAALPLQRIVNQTVAVFAAPDGLSILQDGLRAAGAQVIDVPIYQRRARQSDLPTLSVGTLAALAAIQFASVMQLELWLGRYAAVIAAATAANANWQSEIIVIVPSTRVAAAAERAGFAKIRVQSVSDDTALARFLLT